MQCPAAGTSAEEPEGTTPVPEVADAGPPAQETHSSARVLTRARNCSLQDMSENMGLRALNARLQDPDCAPWFGNLFPRDTPRSMRFAINFFTSIGACHQIAAH